MIARRISASVPLDFDWRRTLALTETALLLGVGTLLVARRLSGAFNGALTVQQHAATLLLVAAFAFGGRLLWRQSRVAAAAPVECAFAWAGTVAIWLMWLGCAPPRLNGVAWAPWIALVAADYYLRRAFLQARPRPRAEATVAAPPAVVVEASTEPAPEGDVLQRLVRSRDASGLESVTGTLVADFALGQRHATLHVGFCPPLERLPVIETEPIDGPDVVVKVVQALAHGVRLELRLAEPADDACRVVVEFVARPG